MSFYECDTDGIGTAYRGELLLMRAFIAGLLLLVAARHLQAQQRMPPTGVVDSVVLSRTHGDLCFRDCEIADVVLPRGHLSTGALELIVARARAAGFYELPKDLPGNVAFCRVALSDGLMATLTIFHDDGSWSVGGYHHCAGDTTLTDSSPAPPEKKRLVALEAFVDSIAKGAHVQRP